MSKSTNPLTDDLIASNPAVDLIRAKVSRAYQTEPDASEEIAEIQTERVLSKHQMYMQSLSDSGKSLAEIQTEWHHYYTTLTDAEKHEVWQEFYSSNQEATPQPAAQPSAQQVPAHIPQSDLPAKAVVADHTPVEPEPITQPRSKAFKSKAAINAASAHAAKLRQVADKPAVHDLKNKIANRVSANGRLSAKHHLQSLGFGLASGLVVLIFLLFTFFNEYIIAPFIQPSRNVSNAPIILNNVSATPDTPPSVTVPNINIQIPINFNVPSYDESVVEDGLKSGVIHYPNTALPGQNGNGAYFGHSSGNIFNNGKYKFAFTLLHDLKTGDNFYIAYGGKTYAYRVFAREIVPPTQVSVINDTKGKQATAELITCDPPGISTNRLVVWGEQISPAVTSNAAPAPTAATTTVTPKAISGNGPTLFRRMINGLEFWN